MAISQTTGTYGSQIFTGPNGSQLVVGPNKMGFAFQGANGRAAAGGIGPYGGAGLVAAGPNGVARGSVSANGIVRAGALGVNGQAGVFRGNLNTGNVGFLARDAAGSVTGDAFNIYG